MHQGHEKDESMYSKNINVKQLQTCPYYVQVAKWLIYDPEAMHVQVNHGSKCIVKFHVIQSRILVVGIFSLMHTD